MQNPAQLWLYNSGTSEWHFIHGAGAQSISGEIDGNAAYCGRPSIGQNPSDGKFYAAWEEFDSTNFEPSTGRLRADIFIASSPDGSAWSDPIRLTNADETSKRFPFLARNCAGDSLVVGFEQDSIAGFNTSDVGAISRNPICVWRGRVTGIEEGPKMSDATRCTPNATIVRDRLVLSQSPFTNRHSRIVLVDAAGREVLPLHAGSNDVSTIAPGVYFVQWFSGNRTQQARLSVVR
jgi:hypothetical protein